MTFSSKDKCLGEDIQYVIYSLFSFTIRLQLRTSSRSCSRVAVKVASRSADTVDLEQNGQHSMDTSYYAQKQQNTCVCGVSTHCFVKYISRNVEWNGMSVCVLV